MTTQEKLLRPNIMPMDGFQFHLSVSRYSTVNEERVTCERLILWLLWVKNKNQSRVWPLWSPLFVPVSWVLCRRGKQTKSGPLVLTVDIFTTVYTTRPFYTTLILSQIHTFLNTSSSIWSTLCWFTLNTPNTKPCIIKPQWVVNSQNQCPRYWPRSRLLSDAASRG